MIYSYQCQKCKTEQEKWHKLEEQNTEPCEKCGAPPKQLKKLLAAVRPHGTWGRWRV